MHLAFLIKTHTTKLISVKSSKYNLSSLEEMQILTDFEFPVLNCMIFYAKRIKYTCTTFWFHVQVNSSLFVFSF